MTPFRLGFPLLCVLAACSHSPCADDPPVRASAPGRRLLADPGLVVHRLVEREGPIGRASQLSRELPDDVFDPFASWLVPSFVDRDGQILLAEGGHALVLGDLVVVIDTGIGHGAERTPRDDHAPFLVALRAAGIAPEDVDIVVNTHLHSDHIGWNTFGAGTPTFPNARYKVPSADWDHARAHGDEDLFATVRQKIQPLVDAGLVDFVDGSETLVPGVRLERWPGHTPGTQVVVVEQGGRRVVFAGDVLHHPAQAALPELDLFATDRDASVASRERFLARYADGTTRIIPTHCTGPGWGTLVPDGAAYRFESRND
jgi:glyoxylase-like metal-dependent hydrolase (beta-lactamase superfamily II)